MPSDAAADETANAEGTSSREEVRTAVSLAGFRMASTYLLAQLQKMLDTTVWFLPPHRHLQGQEFDIPTVFMARG